MKKLTYSLLLFSFAAIFASCGESTSETTEERTDTMATANANNNGMNNTQGDDDEDFVEDAMEANTKEVRMLNQGISMLTNAELKAAARKMLADHQKMDADMKAYVSKKNMQLDLDTATTDHDNMHDAKKGAEYDRDWIDMMVKDHQKVVDMFEDEQDDVKDPELKTMITGALPTLRKHLEDSKALQDKMKK
jgi:putative membrane protein